MQVASAIIYITAVLFSALILFNKKITMKKISIFILLVIVFGCYLYKLDTFPNIFIDEANGYYDAYSLAKYGVDSHLMRFPIYLQSHAGQGQSVLLVYLSVPFMKLLGFSLFSFRITLVVLAIVAILLTCYMLNKFYPKLLSAMMLAICTAPYLMAEVRYAMDCNVSLWVAILMTDCLLLGVNLKQILPITFFYLLCGLLAYSYNVAWIYLVFFVFGISFLLYKKRILATKVILLELLLLLFEIIPILTFAIRSNITSLNKTIKLGIFTIPELLNSRVSTSFIDFHGNILKNMIGNVYHGFQMLFICSDGLSWNSLSNFNAYYSFAIILFGIGLYWALKNYRLFEMKILLILLFSNFIIWLTVLPNYNHWMFTHTAVLPIIGIGIARLEKIIPYKYIYSVYLLFFLCFVHAYFTVPRYTGFDIDSIKNVEYIQKVSHRKKVYFDADDKNLLLIVRDFSGISPYTFQRTKDNPYSQKKLAFYNDMANYQRVTQNTELRKSDYLLINSTKNNNHRMKLVKKNIILGNTKYNLFILK